MSRRYTFPTPHAVGPYRLVRFRLMGGYAIADTRARGRYAWTEPHPVTGRPIPLRFPLAEAIDKMTAAAIEDYRP
jgi:hypothetical protein